MIYHGPEPRTDNRDARLRLSTDDDPFDSPVWAVVTAVEWSNGDIHEGRRILFDKLDDCDSFADSLWVGLTETSPFGAPVVHFTVQSYAPIPF